MKDAEMGCRSVNDTGRFHELFTAQQTEIEKCISVSKTLPQEELQEHFNKITTLVHSLQHLYSTSSPYLKIYDRKICQDTLQTLQTSLQETEIELIPRKKFAFKGLKNKVKTVHTTTNGSSKIAVETKKAADVIDGLQDCLFCDRTDEVLIVPAAAVAGKAIFLSRLRNCTLQILGSPSTVHITDVVGCSISCGPVATSVFVEEAHTCNMQLSCQQLRIHQSTATDFRIHVTSKAIIEDCSGLRFGVYSFRYPTLDEDYIFSGLNKDINNWYNVDDFNWLAAGEPSPNWCLIHEDES